MVAAVEAAADDQPRNGIAGRLEYGRFLRPNVTVAGFVAVERVWSGTDRGALGTSTLAPGLSATLGVSPLRLGLNAAINTLQGGPGTEAPVLWEAGGHVRLGAGTVARLETTRERYSWTLASIDTLILVHSWELALDRSGEAGWAGELVGRREGFGDGNPIVTAYGWLLGPVSRSARHSLRLGYAASWQDSKESNWVPAERPGAGPGVMPGADGSVPGRYAPYYTPHRVVTHAVLGGGAVAVGSGWITVDASVGVHARELAPVLHASPGSPTVTELTFHERSFTPYRLATEWTTPLDRTTSLVIGAAYSRTAYYGLGTARLTLARSL
jgi:hypothetical protein